VYNSELNLANANYSNRCLLISGANGSGKTLYAKQVAIILFLAHIGSYVPAERCAIPIVDSIQAFNPSGSLFQKKTGIKE
jgi:DNA mismatch repair protein MSH5